jgi:hypothetical protein
MASPQYIAGFFDGEGCVGLYKNGRGTYHLRVQVVQNVTKASAKLFDELRILYGGAWCPRKGKKSANWQLSGDNAEYFLKELQPHVRLKKDQVNLALHWLAVKQRPGRDVQGRMMKHERDREEDVVIAKALKELKRCS